MTSLERSELFVTRSLAVRAFGKGFAAGADPLRGVRGHLVEPGSHEHWRRGFEAGREAAESAERIYGKALAGRDRNRRRPRRRR